MFFLFIFSENEQEFPNFFESNLSKIDFRIIKISPQNYLTAMYVSNNNRTLAKLIDPMFTSIRFLEQKCRILKSHNYSNGAFFWSKAVKFNSCEKIT